MPLATTHRLTAASIVPDWVQAEDDGSIPLANVTGVTSAFSLIQANATIGDGPYGTTTGDFDAYRFKSDHGTTHTIDIDARILGSSLDAVIEVYSTNGTLITSNNNDPAGGLDPFLTFTTLEFNVEYIVIVKASDSSIGQGVGTDAWLTGDYRIFINNQYGSAARIQHGDNAVNTLTGTTADDVLVGNGGADSLNGGDGNDLFVWKAGDGNDVITGGNGTDVQEVNASNNSETFNLTPHFGPAFLDMLGVVGGNVFLDTWQVEGMDLRALGGNDVFNVSPMGGSGLTGAIRFFGGAGNDTLNASAAGNVLTAFGEADNDTLNGGLANDTLDGGAGADILNGGAGSDILSGGVGDDLFYVDNAGDVVNEFGGGGSDRVLASVSYTLPGGAGGAIEKLTTTNNAGIGAINLTGNNGVNAIFGNAGANVLDGRGGADTLVGLGGDDWLYVDDAGDVVVEGAGQGLADRVLASVNYTLGAAAQVEILSTTNSVGTGAIALTGNGFANTIYGNAGANTLNGAGGADTLSGLGGDDRFMVDNVGDVVVEAVGEGVDQVFASVDYALAAGSFIEVLSTTATGGLANLTLTGNELGNIVMGNAGSNALKGLAGRDVLYGGGGGDAFVFNTALDAATNVDRILDFVPTDDVIILASGVFAGIAAGTLSAGAFAIGAAAAEADDRIVYNNADGGLFYDSDGVGGAAQVLFATLTGAPIISNLDFMVV